MTLPGSLFATFSALQRALVKALTAAVLAIPALLFASASNAADLPVLKVGDQSLQTRGILEASGQLKDLPYKIEWFNFPAAQPLGEALNAGAVDVGGLGDAPLVFALAAGARVRAVAATRSNPLDLAIVVGPQSPLTEVANLKGKRLATTRGSIGHYLALAALKKANVSPSDVTFVFLAPADAKAALASGSVDAWSVWDPYTALGESRDHDRIIANGVGLSEGLSYQVATETAIAAKRAQLADFLRRVATGQRWALTHPDEVAAMQSRVTGLPTDVLKTVYQRGQVHPVAIDDSVVAAQQRTADTYEAASVIRAHLDVRASFDRSFPLP
ncbi:MAG: ABC-type nitrate/sulfonate/bicarbonate transport systems, periplasmic components [uncultured Paraburkholderia sp.]|uniref:ABC transporter substrate-binding protein n=1 Tax=uncultured Paraburkholderia sp. TaxID=1822466 RepID=UPI00259A3C19|nr:ABC transporter substrate-binding protein [uncultured Paraburkholderia sp.]CAH2899751.1 MAG: ABC-type nitrate/sulfonate/bicarbonate transport systems, periplasmic components [uncultured Paraburkholderia sp.]CAH2940995.1 MAG: ABC-type nitrate/sulfonate/bicarbonate transport systems, periplasmic components [uncultured Paraburkholderia sp.]